MFLCRIGLCRSHHRLHQRCRRACAITRHPHCRRVSIPPSLAVAPRAIHHHQVAIAPSIAVITIALEVNCRCSGAVLCCLSLLSCHRAIPCRQGACGPSIATAPRRPSLLRRRPLPYITIYCRPMPSIHPLPLSCRRAVHRSPLPIAVETPLCRPLLSSPSSRLLPSNCQHAIHCPSRSSVHHRRAFNCCRSVNCN